MLLVIYLLDPLFNNNNHQLNLYTKSFRKTKWILT